ncbi:hypothetical protein GCM10023093_02570 [Nemorincola caseinilytica]|uniref:DUF5723 domain-containing protein n=1 Tax=Nemorincola caseinilytica TaxID=2054315 RepID=A0ABP8N729_9BACT
MKRIALYFLIFLISGRGLAQGTFSGDFMTNLNFFMKDTAIRASDNPLYDNALSGSDAWLTLRYATNGFTFFVRADGFANSNLKDPIAPNTDFGIGAWSVTKDLGDLTIIGGSIYDQIGTGILFRSYEDRGLLIDNALTGFELKYKFSNSISAKGFVGQLKNNNSPNNLINNVRYMPVIKAINFEADHDLGKVHISPGIGVMNRTLDATSMNSIVEAINNMDTSMRFIPKYNMYAFTVYNNLIYKNLSWYIEGAYKTHEAIRLTNTPNNDLGLSDGNIIFTSLNYGRKGYAISLTGKRTDHFVMRTSPNEVLLQGMLNWQPVVAVMRPLRLMSRYQPPSQDIAEMAGTANLTLSPSDVTTINLTYSHINTLDGEKLYREAYAEAIYQGMDKWVLEGGVQYIDYNVALYQNRGTAVSRPILTAITPFAEITYKINDNKSIRLEAQYMHAELDYGSWLFGLLEYNVAPRWSIAVTDMFNCAPNTTGVNTPPGYIAKTQNYYNIFVAHTRGANRFTLAYVKQVDGINCTGGVCRYEPAFSGVKATVTSSF